MDKSFTDKVIEDLNQNKEDTRRSTISRWVVLKGMFEDLMEWDNMGTVSAMVIVLLLIIPVTFVTSTRNLVRSPNRISVAEEKIFQIFEVRNIPIEIMSLSDPSLSEVVEKVSVPFTEFIELATEYGIVYFSQKPLYEMFVVGEHRDIVHYYANNNIWLAYYTLNIARRVSLITGIIGLVMILMLHKSYRTKYKEMVGF